MQSIVDNVYLLKRNVLAFSVVLGSALERLLLTPFAAFVGDGKSRTTAHDLVSKTVVIVGRKIL